jgi:chromate transporter
LFLGFLGLGMTAFGGALPLAHRMIVERRRWLTDPEFVELLGLCLFRATSSTCRWRWA